MLINKLIKNVHRNLMMLLIFLYFMLSDGECEIVVGLCCRFGGSEVNLFDV